MTGSLQTKNNKFYIVLNTTENGKRKQKWIATGLPIKGNKRTAEKMLRDALADAESKKTAMLPNKLLFSDYLQIWLGRKAALVDEVTAQGYTMLMEKHIVPYFTQKQVLLIDVTWQQVQAFLDEKRQSGRLDGKGGLSPKSVREIKNLLNQAFNDAIREGYISINPCSLVVLPSRERPATNFYTREQLQRLMVAVEGETLSPLIHVAIYYGLRRSELVGLKWNSIDFENNTLTINHTVVKVNKVVAKDKTKTKSSHRTFPLLPEMRELFLALRQTQEENRSLFGKNYIQTDYVFCWPDGRQISNDYVSHRFNELLKKHNLPHIRFHELRHSCASLLINQGIGLKEVQDWMGHSDISTTANIYGHLETQRKVAMANALSECLGNSR